MDIRQMQVDRKAKNLALIYCQSPLNCGNKAVVWNQQENMYLCSHCQAVLNDLKTGISVIFP